MDQILLGVLSVLAVACTQANYPIHKWAPIFGILSQPFWLYSTWTAGLYGIFLLSVLYTLIWAYGCWKYWIKKEEPLN